MGSSSADLLALQGHIKRDADSYKDDFLLQYRHYSAVLEIFKLKPGQESKEFGELVTFMAQVCKSYPIEGGSIATDVISLLDSHAAVLEPGLRRTLVQSLILLRNRGQIEPGAVLPLFFRLFRCRDKALRTMLFKHIVTDIKNSNKKHRNEKLNRGLQSFLYSVVADDNESAAKKSLAVLTELWRRHVWRDARTINVIASAAFHKSTRVMLAVMKFFLGQDTVNEDGEDEDNEERGEDAHVTKVTAPTKEDIYRANNKGTFSSKKKKKRKLARVMATIKKAGRKDAAVSHEGFAAMHLLHDPQSFVEKLFSKLQSCTEKFETRVAIMSVISRVVGMHKLLLLNFYPFLQKYIAPHQREVTSVLAALVQAAHDLVPPETLAPVMKQLVNQFVHDKARPEVMTIGLKSVRELCLRCPLVMNEDLLRDLTEYRKFRDKSVSSAAKGLIGLFRELNPEMLLKKDRGRGADIAHKPKSYGQVDTQDRVQGAELLEAALLAGAGSEDDEYNIDSEDDGEGGEGDEDEEDDGSGEWEDVSEEGEEGAEKSAKSPAKAKKASADKDSKQQAPGSAAKGKKKQQAEEKESEEEESEDGEAGEGESEEMSSEEGGEGESDDGEEGEEDEESEEEEADRATATPKQKGTKRAHSPEPRKQQEDSLSALKRKLAKRRSSSVGPEDSSSRGGTPRQPSVTPGVHIEMDRILTSEDFERIRKLRQKALIEAAMSKHGLKSAPAAKKRRMLEAAEEEAEEAMQAEDAKGLLGENRLRAEDLMGKHKRRHDKEERMASIMKGREGREEFGSSKGRQKKKAGGLTEREKQKKKAMPIAARIDQLRKRSAVATAKARCPKNFKGHKNLW